MCVRTLARLCVYANGFRLHLKATNYLKLIASNAFVYDVLKHAIEIGKCKSERTSKLATEKNWKDMCITYTTPKTI